MLGVVNLRAIHLSLIEELTIFPLKSEKDRKSGAYVRRVNFHSKQMRKYRRSQKNTLLHSPLKSEKVLTNEIKTKVVKFLPKKMSEYRRSIHHNFQVTHRCARLSPHKEHSPLHFNLKIINE